MKNMEMDRNLKSPGRKLKKAREEQELSVEVVAQRLNLSVRQIQSLDNDDYEEFPAVAYVRGHLRSYANIVGLDPDRLINEFDQDASVAPALEPFVSQPNQQVGIGDKHIKAVTYSLIAALGLLLVLWWQSNRSTEETADLNDDVSMQAETLAESGIMELAQPEVLENIGEATDVTLSLPEPESSLSIKEKEEMEEPKVLEHDYAVVHFSDLPTPPDQNLMDDVVEALPQEEQTSDLVEATTQDQITNTGRLDDQRIILQFTDEAWVQIKDSTGNTRFSRIGNAGEVVSMTGGAPFNIIIGKASVVIMNYQGEIVDLNSLAKGEVARFTLDEKGAHR